MYRLTFKASFKQRLGDLDVGASGNAPHETSEIRMDYAGCHGHSSLTGKFNLIIGSELKQFFSTGTSKLQNGVFIYTQ